LPQGSAPPPPTGRGPNSSSPIGNGNCSA
jgi:hypothetical protein